MSLLHALAIGMIHVFLPFNFLMLVIGILVGMAVSITPGLGLVMGVVLALPFTYRMAIEPSIILLTAIYITGTYAGCFTTILYRIPGEPSDVPLLWDGYSMTCKGQAARALGWALVGALIGGIISSSVMVSVARPLAKFALDLNSPDYFAVVVLGLTTVVSLATGSLGNALISLFIGLMISTIGVDSVYGTLRFTFGNSLLIGGINYITVLVGAYGLGEVFIRFGQTLSMKHMNQTDKHQSTAKTHFPSWCELWHAKGTLLRSSIIGTLLGIVPGAGAVITSFVAYGVEKQYCKRRHQLGSGIGEGVVAPQIASTASVAGHMIPLLTLGIPGSGATAVILGAFLLHGVQPGPYIFVEHPNMAYSILASLFVGVIGMCIIGFLWIRVVINILKIPQPIIYVIVVLFCIIGAYARRNDMADVWLTIIFGVVGFLFEKFRFSIAPMILGVILGPIAESSFIRTMIQYNNNWLVFFTRPISGTLLILAVIAFLYPILTRFRKSKVAQAV